MARKPVVVEVVAPTVDLVNEPPHYLGGEVECIDAIESALGARGFADYLRGQVIKYQWRLAGKGAAVEDAQKALWYNNRLVAHLGAHPDLYDE